MPVPATLLTIDVRQVAPRERHPLVISTFRGLAANQAMELLNDHDPRPLYYQLQEEMPGKVGWEEIQSGPEVWRVRVTKLAREHGNGHCCGACGGI